jgi:hypothetical protein
LAVDQLDVFYTSRAEYDLDISGQLINKLKVSDSDDLDSLDWQEVDLSSQDYQAQLNSLFNSEYDFSLESGYPKIEFLSFVSKSKMSLIEPVEFNANL